MSNGKALQKNVKEEEHLYYLTILGCIKGKQGVEKLILIRAEDNV